VIGSAPAFGGTKISLSTLLSVFSTPSIASGSAPASISSPISISISSSPPQSASSYSAVASSGAVSFYSVASVVSFPVLPTDKILATEEFEAACDSKNISVCSRPSAFCLLNIYAALSASFARRFTIGQSDYYKVSLCVKTGLKGRRALALELVEPMNLFASLKILS